MARLTNTQIRERFLEGYSAVNREQSLRSTGEALLSNGFAIARRLPDGSILLAASVRDFGRGVRIHHNALKEFMRDRTVPYHSIDRRRLLGGKAELTEAADLARQRLQRSLEHTSFGRGGTKASLWAAQERCAMLDGLPDFQAVELPTYSEGERE